MIWKSVKVVRPCKECGEGAVCASSDGSVCSTRDVAVKRK